MYKNKTIIQIGSHEGKTSNDPIFEEVDDTTKIFLMEPVPFLFYKLQNNYREKYGDSSNIVYINKAVSNFVGQIEMTIPSEKNNFHELPIWASQISSINPDHALAHIHNILLEKIMVQTTTINEIIEEYNIKEIELLHTDTEGHDFIILMNYDFIIKPKKIIFEHKHMDGVFNVGVNYTELSNRLISFGYKKIHKNAEDSTFELL